MGLSPVNLLPWALLSHRGAWDPSVWLRQNHIGNPPDRTGHRFKCHKVKWRSYKGPNSVPSLNVSRVALCIWFENR